jgi:curli biogenesis system outer membrane secretion channel CsgG
MKSLLQFSALTAALLAAGCVSTDTQTNTTKRSNHVRSVVVDEYGNTTTVGKTLHCPGGAVEKISIAPFKCSASQCKELPQATGNLAVFVQLAGKDIGPDFSQLGTVMSSMVASSLEQTGCFEVLDRDALAELKLEMEMAGQEWKPERADLLITGAITSLTYQKRESGIAGSGLTLGLFSNEQSTARIGLDVRLIDVSSSKVAYSETYSSDATRNNYAFGAANSEIAAATALGGDLEVEEAVRTIINQTVYDVVKSRAEGAYTEETVSIN